MGWDTAGWKREIVHDNNASGSGRSMKESHDNAMSYDCAFSPAIL